MSAWEQTCGEAERFRRAAALHGDAFALRRFGVPEEVIGRIEVAYQTRTALAAESAALHADESRRRADYYATRDVWLWERDGRRNEELWALEPKS